MTTLEPDADTVQRMATRDALRELSGPALASGVLALIEMHRERWDQDQWRGNTHPWERYEKYQEDPLNPACRTAFCFAGWVAAIDGRKWFRNDPAMIGEPTLCDCEGKTCNNSAHMISVRTYARDRLGLSGSEGVQLFSGCNTLNDLRNLVAAHVHGTRLDDVVLEREAS